MTAPGLKRRPVRLDSPAVGALVSRGSQVQTWLYRRTNGRVGGTWRIGSALRKPVPVLLLDHVGRRSGRKLTTPLLYLRYGDHLVVVASKGGTAGHPQWYRNLIVTPEVQVQVGDELRLVRARVAGGAERAALWGRLVELYADLASYQSGTDREIPVVVLERR